MIVLSEKIRDAAIVALEALAKRCDIPPDAQMELQITAGVLSYSRHLEGAGTFAIREHCGKAADLLGQLLNEVKQPDIPEGFLRTVEALQADARSIANAPIDTSLLQASFMAFLSEFDHLFVNFARSVPVASQALLTQMAGQLMNWQVGMNCLSQVPAASADTVARNTGVKVEDMQSLLRARMGDPSLTIGEWTVLTGGFGKETCLFTVKGDNISADMVMRRDVDANLITGVDCHEVKQEYPLLKAVFDLGFPVPEPLFLETNSTAVKGPDFIIVRRVPGKVGGNQFGGEGKVATPIQHELAKVTASLHKLPPMLHLGDASRELRPELWSMSVADCVRDYMSAWYRLYLARPHMPIPAVHGMFNWLLAHVPDTDERPSLVHGDIGLHNLLFHEGKLATVLDWEFSHIGDPAEDVGIIYAVMGGQLDWDDFLDAYSGAGRPAPSMQRVRFFEIWMYFRNLIIASMCLEQFASGHLKQIRYGVFATRFIPHYIERVSALIRDWCYQAGPA